MKSLKAHSEAKNDLRKSAKWYEKQQPGRGFAFTDAVEETYRKILAHPTAWPPLRKDVRHLEVKKYPYHVVYVIRVDAIWVVAIAHDSRRPNFWTKRLKDIPSN